MRLKALLPIAVLAAAVFPTHSLFAQSTFASRVVAYRPGPGVGAPFHDPSRALGAPAGAGRTSGSLDVVGLGRGGTLTLAFDLPITDGPGADFLVFENAFIVGLESTCFAEIAFVEVSSNGIDFARFPVSYTGPASSIGPYGALLPGSWKGFAGTTPVFANPTIRPAIDPRDPARAGGDAFDLRVLRTHPLVGLGKLNVFRITHVRIVDVEDGKHRDMHGRLIRDPSVGSADIDAVAVVNFFGKPTPSRPILHLELDAMRRVRFEIGDPDGLQDLDARRLALSAQGDPLDLGAFLSLSRLVRADSRSVVFESLFTVPKDFPFVLGLSAKDRAGSITGAALHLH